MQGGVRAGGGAACPCLQPDLDALRDFLDGIGEDDLRILGRLQPRRFEPHVFVHRARKRPVTDHLARADELSRHLLEAGGGDPTRAVPWVRLRHALEEEPRLLDVADLGLRRHLDRVEIRQVSLRIDHGLSAHRVAHLVELHREHRAARLADALQVGKRCRAARHRRLEAARLLLPRLERGVGLRFHPRAIEQRVGGSREFFVALGRRAVLATGVGGAAGGDFEAES